MIRNCVAGYFLNLEYSTGIQITFPDKGYQTSLENYLMKVFDEVN